MVLMPTEPSEATGDADTAEVVEVYWRPGCPYCNRLLRHFDDAEVSYRLHNIWEDDEARSFVRAHNNGNETVPTVVLFDAVVTNPDPLAFIDALRLRHPEFLTSLSE